MKVEAHLLRVEIITATFSLIALTKDYNRSYVGIPFNLWFWLQNYQHESGLVNLYQMGSVHIIRKQANNWFGLRMSKRLAVTRRMLFLCV
jgi:hypothetical protein